MKRLADIFKIGWQMNELKILHNCVPQRGLRSSADIKWVFPEQKPFYHPSVTGDLAGMPPVNKNTLKLEFQNTKNLESVSDLVKRTFSLEYQSLADSFAVYRKEMVDKVKSHPLDESSKEVKIAKLTARIRWFQARLETNPKKVEWKVKVKKAIDTRKKNLRQLRLSDYPKFEWLLEKLDLEYRPEPRDKTITRKKSLTLIANFTLEKKKEERVAALKQSLDEQKVPFLEKKLEKLRWIKEMEAKHNITPTVTDADIDECIKKIQEVKIVVADRMKRGYVRKVHPYFLEVYDEDLLLEKERGS